MAGDRFQDSHGGADRRPVRTGARAWSEEGDPSADDAPSPNLVVWMILGGAVGLALMIGMFIYGVHIKRWPDAKFPVAASDVPLPLPPPDVEDPERKTREILAAFRAPTPTAGADDVESATRFLNDLFAVLNGEEKDGFAALIDHEQVFERIKRSGGLTSLTERMDEAGVPNVRRILEPPSGWKRFRLMELTVAPDGDSAVAWLNVWMSDGSFEPMRFWLTRANAGWRAADWEWLTTGERISTTLALQFNPPGGSGRHQPYLNARTRDLEYFQHVKEQRYVEANAALDRAVAEVRTLDDSLPSDQARLVVADALSRANRMTESYEIHRTIRSPDQVPGTWHGRALCLRSAGRAERALDDLGRLERALGPGPLVHPLRGELLLSLGRRQAAADEWIKACRTDPGNPQHLAPLAQCLSDDESERLVEFVERTEDPTQTAANVMADYRIVSRPATLRKLADFIEAKRPGSALSLSAQAGVRSAESDAAGAFELMKRAVDAAAEGDERTRMVQSYYRHAWQAKKELELLAKADDPKEVFKHLSEFFSEDYDDEPVAIGSRGRKLVAAFREKAPDDSLGLFVHGRVLQEDKKDAEAETFYRLALAGADAELTERIQAQLRELSVRQGRILEKYRESPTHEVFVELATRLRWSNRTSELEALVAARRDGSPNDEALPLFEAVVAQQKGRYAEAYDRFRSLSVNVKPEVAAALEKIPNSHVQYAWLESAVLAGKILDYYDDAQPPGSEFDTVAQRLRSQNDWRRLAQLVATHRQRFPNDPGPNEWQLIVDSKTGNHLAVVQAMLATGKHLSLDGRTGSGPFRYSQGSAQDLYFRSLVRLDRLDDALDFAELCEDRLIGDQVPTYGLIVAGDADRLLRYYAGLSSPRYLLSRAYLDEEFGPRLESAAFLKFREANPPDVPWNPAGARVVLLLKTPWNPEAAELERSLAPHLGRAAVTKYQLPPKKSFRKSAEGDEAAQAETTEKGEQTSEATSVTHFLVDNGRGRWLLSVHPSAYLSEESREALPDPMRSLQAEGRGWLAVAELPLSPGRSAECKLDSGKLLTSLLSDRTLAVYSENWARLSPVTDEFRRDLQSVGLVESLFDEQRLQYLQPEIISSAGKSENAAEVDDETKPFYELQREFHDAFERRKEGDRFRVQTTLLVGTAYEAAWFEVSRLEPQSWGGWTLIGKVETTPQLAPRMSPEETYAVNAYRVTDYEYPVDGAIRRGSTSGEKSK